MSFECGTSVGGAAGNNSGGGGGGGGGQWGSPLPEEQERKMQ